MNLSLACKADRILGSIGYLFLKLFRKKNALAKPEEVKTVAVVKFLGGGRDIEISFSDPQTEAPQLLECSFWKRK